MPKGDPFTALCQLAAATDTRVVADLHLHTTASDGDLTPSQLVHLARAAKLRAIAVTDHDTTAGFEAAAATVRALDPPNIEIVPGVEVSAEFDGREVHILGLFVDPANGPLQTALEGSRIARQHRFRAFVTALAVRGVNLDPGLVEVTERASVSLGRRHLAGLLLQAGVVRNRFEAFQRFLQPLSPEVTKSHLISAPRAVELIREAGGLAALAHPGDRIDETAIARLTDFGMNGIEIHFPAANLSRTAELRRIAGEFSLACTGGTDLHAPADRAVGGIGVTRTEWNAVRERVFGS